MPLHNINRHPSPTLVSVLINFSSVSFFCQLVIKSDYNNYFKKSRLDQEFGRRDEFREDQCHVALIDELHPAR